MHGFIGFIVFILVVGWVGGALDDWWDGK